MNYPIIKKLPITEDKFHTMKLLLTTTGIFEGITGLALAIVPSLVISLLLGTSLTDAAGILIARLAGTALLTIAIACWLSRNDVQSSIMVKVMLAYNMFSLLLLLYAVLIERISGRAMWPAVLAHLGLLAWCVSSLRTIVQKTI